MSSDNEINWQQRWAGTGMIGVTSLPFAQMDVLVQKYLRTMCAGDDSAWKFQREELTRGSTAYTIFANYPGLPSDYWLGDIELYEATPEKCEVRLIGLSTLTHHPETLSEERLLSKDLKRQEIFLACLTCLFTNIERNLRWVAQADVLVGGGGNITAYDGQFGVVGNHVVVQGGIHFHGKPDQPPESPVSTPDLTASGSYDLTQVRALLNHVFDEVELRNYCFDEPLFRPVHDDLKPTDDKSEIIRRILDRANRKGLVAQLLAWAKDSNPSRYAEGEPYETY